MTPPMNGEARGAAPTKHYTPAPSMPKWTPTERSAWSRSTLCHLLSLSSMKRLVPRSFVFRDRSFCYGLDT